MIQVIDLRMLSIYADTQCHLKMLYRNTVKMITPYGDATIVICTKVEVVRLGSNNIWLEKGPGSPLQECATTYVGLLSA
jgi:hypothetical protein